MGPELTVGQLLERLHRGIESGEFAAYDFVHSMDERDDRMTLRPIGDAYAVTLPSGRVVVLR